MPAPPEGLIQSIRAWHAWPAYSARTTPSATPSSRSDDAIAWPRTLADISSMSAASASESAGFPRRSAHSANAFVPLP